MRKYIIGAGVVVLAVWVGFSWGQKSAVAPQAEEAIGVVATTTVATTATKNPTAVINR